MIKVVIKVAFKSRSESFNNAERTRKNNPISAMSNINAISAAFESDPSKNQRESETGRFAHFTHNAALALCP